VYEAQTLTTVIQNYNFIKKKKRLTGGLKQQHVYPRGALRRTQVRICRLLGEPQKVCRWNLQRATTGCRSDAGKNGRDLPIILGDLWLRSSPAPALHVITCWFPEVSGGCRADEAPRANIWLDFIGNKVTEAHTTMMHVFHDRLRLLSICTSRKKLV
jgi:hypothetical protein